MNKSCLIMKGKQGKATRQRKPFKAFRTNRPLPGPVVLMLLKAPRSSGKLALCDWVILIPLNPTPSYMSTRPLAVICVFGFHLENGLVFFFFFLPFRG